MSETVGPDDPSQTPPPPPPRRRMLAGLVGLLVLALVVVVVALLADGADDDDDLGTGETDPTVTPSTPTDEPEPAQGPGTLISKSAFTTAVPATMQAWRIVYETTDEKGRRDTATATVLAARELPDGPRPVIGVGHGTVGIASRCAPSLSQQPFTGSVTALATLVEQGWVAVTSDYAGMGTAGPTPYLVGKGEARNVLDAVRAAHEVLELSPETLLLGHSQGGHAVLWAGIEAPTYSPELDVVGVAATAPASDLFDLISTIRGTLGGTLVTMYLQHAWQQVYPTAGLDQELRAGVGSVIDRASRLCLTGAEAAEAYTMARGVLDAVVDDAAYDGEFGRLLRANSPTGPIDAPVLVAQGLADVLVPASVQRAWVAQRCAGGQAIDYREYAAQTHTSLVHPASPLMEELVQWAQDRLAGKPARGNCR